MGGCLSCPSREPSRPSTSPRSEGDRHPPSGKADDRVDFRRGYWGDAAAFCWNNLPLSLANALECYEFTAYSSMEVWLSLLFFHGSTTATWAVFGITFVLRPLGGLMFGVAADLVGRRPAVLTALIAMCGSTVGQGLAPTVPCLGAAWLITCRMVQGLAAGGEMGSVAVILAEQAPPHLLGMSGFPIQAGCLIGFTLSNVVTVALLRSLTAAQMLAWGWRLPFLLAAAPGAVAVYGAWAEMPETDDFQELQRAATEEEPGDWASQIVALRAYGLQGLLSVAGNATDFASTYVAGLYVTEWAIHWCGLTRNQSLLLSIAGRVGAVVCCLPVGAVADHWGIGRASLAVAAVGVVTSIPMYAVWYRFPDSTAVVVCAGIVLPALLQGSAMVWYPWTASLFPTKVRGTGVCLYFNLASFTGGLAPVLCSLSPAPLFLAYYSLAAALTSLVATAAAVALHRQREAGGTAEHCMAHLRPDLY
eukprot:GGOE01061930.1.p1 GENE.GGOE01061930.1~~GGOE01061930.1.p1  ORF type:complete len:516 (-),score=108.76 GGOE01061930.1:117-1544(-)